MELRISILIVVSVISVMASLIVVSTPLIFSSMRTKLFMKIVAFISLGDIIGNFPYMFPYRPSTGNWWCSLQSFMNLAGYPMGWLWTVALVYLLYRLAITGRLPNALWPMHVICWGLPVLLALLTLVFSKYTQNVKSYDVCVENTESATEIYHGVAYYGLLSLCFVIMVLLFLKIYLLQWSKDPNVLSTSFTVAKSALQWYPTLMIFFWVPHAVTSIYYHESEVYFICLNIKIAHGLATAAVFIAQSRETRRLWHQHVLSVYLPANLLTFVSSHCCCCNRKLQFGDGDSNSRMNSTEHSSVHSVDLDTILDHSLILDPADLLAAATSVKNMQNPILHFQQQHQRPNRETNSSYKGSISLHETNRVSSSVQQSPARSGNVGDEEDVSFQSIRLSG